MYEKSIKKTAWLLLACFVFAAGVFAGCSRKQETPDSRNAQMQNKQADGAAGGSKKDGTAADSKQTGTARLTMWCDEYETDMFQKRIEQFFAEHLDMEAEVEFEPVGASICKDTFLGDAANGADLFCIPDDQLLTMAASGVIEEIAYADEVKKRSLKGAVQAASVSGRMYAYPYTADNGYFLYYDKRYFTKEDVRSLDRILELCDLSHKKFIMNWTSGWYLYSFFGNTGLQLELNEDGLTNSCNWNTAKGEIKGTDIAQSLLDIANHPGFEETADSDFAKKALDGTAIAVVSGVWDAADIKKAFGGDYGACRLPEYSCAGKRIQMSSFKGYRLLGVNSYSQHRELAEMLADYLSNEESQNFYFQSRQNGPSDKNAAASEDVLKVPAIAAVLEQSEYGVLQKIGQKYWTPMSVFGETMAKGNPNHIPLQDLMDQLVNGITEI